MIPRDVVAVMYLFDRAGQTVLGLWHRSAHSSDVDWDIARRRVDDPEDVVVRCERHWHADGDRPPRTDRYPE